MKPSKKTLWRSELGKATLVQRPPEIIKYTHFDGPAHLAAFGVGEPEVYRIPMPWMVYGFVFDDKTVKEACLFATEGPVTSGYDILYELPLPNLLNGGWSSKTPFDIPDWTDMAEAELSAFIHLMIDTPHSSDDLGNVHDAYTDIRPTKLMKTTLPPDGVVGPRSTKQLLSNWALWSDVAGLEGVMKWDWHPAWHEASIVDELVQKLDKFSNI